MKTVLIALLTATLLVAVYNKYKLANVYLVAYNKTKTVGVVPTLLYIGGF